MTDETLSESSEKPSVIEEKVCPDCLEREQVRKDSTFVLQVGAVFVALKIVDIIGKIALQKARRR